LNYKRPAKQWQDLDRTVYATGKKIYDSVADEEFDFVNMEKIAISLQAKMRKDQISFTTVTSDGETIDQFTVNEDYHEE
jgi:hypothetical protein